MSSAGGAVRVVGTKSAPHAEEVQARFLARMQAPPMETLFEYLPDVCFFAKDAEGHFVLCNSAFAAMVAARDVAAVIGRRDSDFFPPHLSRDYVRDDQTVMTTRTPLIDKVELVRNRDGSVDWHTTSKHPVLGKDGSVIGLAGITRDLKKMSSTSERFLSMAPVLEAIMNDYGEPLTVRELAAKARLSVSQLERQFKSKFGKTPLKYIAEVRVNAACQLLSSTDLPLSEIAQQTGFCDQSHLTRHFVRSKGTTPSRYRQTYQRAEGPGDAPALQR